MGLQNGTVTSTMTHPPMVKRNVNAQFSPSVQREVVAGFRAQAGRISNTIITEVRRAVPALGSALNGPVGGLLPSAIQAVILRGVDSVLAPRGTVSEDWTEMFRGVGALAYSTGCPIDVLATAYRTGEQVMVDQMRTYGLAHRVTPDAIAVLTNAVSRKVGLLCAVSVEGYETARDSASDTVAERRARLLRMLVDERPSEQRVIVDEAHGARWPLPDAVVAVALHCPKAPTAANLGKLSPDALVDLHGAQPCMVVASDKVDRDALAEAFPGWTVAVGPAVAPTSVAASLGMARKAIALAARKLITDGPVIDCAENSLALALFSDDFLIEQLVSRRLKPLDDLTPRQRERMLATLHEWLAMRGRAGEVAERLGVHPQTVRYRVHQLEELFSDQLSDPRARFELEIAVRAELLRTAARDEPAATAEAC